MNYGAFFDLAGWEFRPERDHALLVALVEGLARVNRAILETQDPRMARIPSLYGSGVRYKRDGRGGEVWRDCISVLENGGADCKSLCAWRMAEIQIDRKPVRVVVEWGPRDETGLRLYHVKLMTRNGIEDPSLMLGMP